MHAALDVGGVRKAVGAKQRGGGNPVAARQRVQGFALGDDDRRAAGSGPSGRGAGHRLLRRGRGGGDALRRQRRGGDLAGRRGSSRRGVRRFRVEGIGERTGAVEPGAVDGASGEPEKRQASQRETREGASIEKRNAITH